MKFTLYLFTLLLLNQNVEAKSSSSVSGVAGKMVRSLVRIGIGGSQTEIKSLEPGSITNFKNPGAIWQDVDLVMPLGLHLGIRETIDQNAFVNFNGAGIKPAELYLSNFEFGAKAMLPLPFFQPWVGGGWIGGFLAITDPTRVRNKNWLLAFDDETKALRGMYWHAGVDLMLGGMGLRFSYQEDTIESDAFSYLNGAKVKFINSRYSAGLVFPLH